MNLQPVQTRCIASRPEACTIAAQYRAFCAAHPPHYRTLAGAVWEFVGAGAGPETLVLLPGGFGVADTAFLYVQALAAQYRVISVSYPDTLGSVAGLADGLAALLAGEGVARAHVLGGSYSGFIAQVFVRRHPALVASLILSHTGAPQPRRARAAAATLALFRLAPMPLLRAALWLLNYGFLPGRAPENRFWRGYFAAMIGRLRRAAYLSRLQVLRDFDLNQRFTPADLNGWPGRLLLAEAARDGLVPAAERDSLRRLYPQAQRRSFAHGRHADTISQPDEQIAMIREFLAGP